MRVWGPPDGSFFRDPYAVYRRMRREAPVRWRRSDTLEGAVLLDYRDVARSLADPCLSSHLDLEDGDAGGAADRLVPGWMLWQDPPAHTRLRRVAAAALRHRVTEDLRGPLVALVEDLLERVRDREVLDLVADLARPLPVAVIADLLGLPPGDRERLQQWARALLGYLDPRPPDPADDRAQQAAAEEARDYFLHRVRRSRREPSRDLVGLMVEQGNLSEEELAAQCVELLFAGHETTVYLIGNAAWTLLRHPHSLRWLAQHPPRARAVVEEVLRYESPVQIVNRVATGDLRRGGHTLRAGEVVFLLLGAANRDPARFADPDRFRPERADAGHLAFGLGPHACPGARLARLEAQAAVAALAGFLQGAEPAGEEPSWLPLDFFRGLCSLPVRLKGGRKR